MRNFSSTELANKTDAALAAAPAAPVSIRHYGTIRFVVLSIAKISRACQVSIVSSCGPMRQSQR
ncbi:MAG: hypothetical protein PHX82_06085 [Paracoccaceae bacterium]|nr:hypothetical protein [Paracoccaceae bacterium]